MDLETWLNSTQKQRDSLDAYGASERPMDAVERSQDIQKAIQASDAVGRLLADAGSIPAGEKDFQSWVLTYAMPSVNV